MDLRARSSVPAGNPGFAGRRRHARCATCLPVVVRLGGRELSAVTEDISPGGASLRLELEVTPEQFVASIQLPGRREIHVLAEVRWRRRAPGRSGVGVRFARFLEEPAAATALT